MIMKLIGYFDKKLGVYSSPISMNDFDTEDLIEQTRRMCANPKVPEAYFDYDLYVFGTFDDKRGEIKVFDKPEFVVSLNDFRNLREQVKEGEAHA